MKIQPVVLAATALLLFVFCFEASAKRISVLVNAKASDAYVEGFEIIEYQTYHLMEGKFYGGSTRDEGLESIRFEDIAESLSKALRKREYYPEPDKKLGDLLIMISWGRTSPDPNMKKALAIDSSEDTLTAKARMQRDKRGGAKKGSSLRPETGTGGDFSTDNADLTTGTAAMVMKGGFTQSRALNTALLGLEEELENEARSGFRGEGGPFWDLLEQERYFVVLNAFDYQQLLQHGEKKQLWTLRYNTRATGVGFPDAMKTMNEAVAHMAGTNSKRMSRIGGTTGATGEVGDLEVISIEEDVKEPVKRKKVNGR